MSLEEAKELARKGVKISHKYFTSNEYFTMQGNQMIFEDGVKCFVSEFLKWRTDSEAFLKDYYVYC